MALDRILIIDAHPTRAADLRQALATKGLKAETVAGGAAAARALLDDQFSAVLVDEAFLRLQGMACLVAVHRKRARPLHVVLMTSNPEHHIELLEMYSLPLVDELLPKPCASDAAVAAVRVLLQDAGDTDEILVFAAPRRPRPNADD